MKRKNTIKKPIDYLKKTKRGRGKKLSSFLRGLFNRKLRGLDSLAIALHEDAFKKINCMDCANCCKTMSPTYTKSDVKRISKHVGMSYQEYFDKYLYIDESKDILNKKTPCQFLQKDNRCGIYHVRPNDCRGFPHTHNRDFKYYIHGTHMQNINYCPATMYMVEKMHEIIIEKGKRNLSASDVNSPGE